MTTPNIADLVKQLRAMIEPNDAELRESLKQNGWVAQLPAIADEHGVILVGNRRTAFAKELGIEPVVEIVTFGTGSEADVARLKLASVSNIGGVAMTPKDRKRIAEHLEKLHWTQRNIALALGVGLGTVSRDLANCSTTEQLKPAKTATNPKGAGRPKKVTEPKVTFVTPKPEITATFIKPPEEPAPIEDTTAMTTGPVVKNKAREIVRPWVEKGETPPMSKLVKQHSISIKTFGIAYGEERAARDAVAAYIATKSPSLPPPAPKPKVAPTIEQYQVKLEAEFDTRVAEKAQEIAHAMVAATMIPTWIKELESVLWKIANRKHVLTTKVFNRIRFALHPDTYKNVEAAERNMLSQTWEELKDALIGEQEHPITAKYKLPTSVADLMKMREVVKAANSAKAKAAAAKRKAAATAH